MHRCPCAVCGRDGPCTRPAESHVPQPCLPCDLLDPSHEQPRQSLLQRGPACCCTVSIYPSDRVYLDCSGPRHSFHPLTVPISSLAVTKMASHRRDSSVARSETHGSYRRGSMVSEASFIHDVDMAQDEMFSGPMSESVPTSNVGFASRRSRSGSTASFAFYEDEDEFLSGESFVEEDAIVDEEADEADAEYQNGYSPHDQDSTDQSSMRSLSRRRKSSGRSHSSRMAQSIKSGRRSSDAPLLRRGDSTGSLGSNTSARGSGSRMNQKIYILSEDLTIVVAGFRTSTIGFAIYITLCICTGGLAFLLLRWVSSWRIKLVGKATPLKECQWVVVENQWGEMAIVDIAEHDYGQSLSTVFGSSEKRAVLDYDEDDDPVIQHLRILDYRYIRFCFHPVRNKFIICNSWKDPAWTDPENIRGGIDTEEKEFRETVFGRNIIDIEQKSISQLLVDEALHPFYIFQVASLILWSMDEYYYYAACIFIISAVSITTTLIETRATQRRLKEISRFECDIRILRNGFWRYVPSSDLVPGDVYEITDPALQLLPCDSLLLTGDCIVNESMLTGESVPVSKVPTTEEALALLDLSASSVHPDVARHMLFSGTKIIRARRPQDGKDDEAAALALVVRTGFNTTKGALVRSMMFPKPSGFKFYQDSFRYIGVMAGIALIGFTGSFINFVRLGLAWRLIIVRALDLITIVVPPALPATLTIGTNFALSRLKEKKIFCISPQRVNVAGKIDVMCFDKTGTLTEEGLDVLGVRLVQQPANRFSEILTSPADILPNSNYERDPTVDYSIHKAALHTMATCHSLRLIDDELVGDPLDVKMFDFTRWQFEESVQQPNLGEDEETNKLRPSVARPPVGQEFDIAEDGDEPNKTPIELGIIKQFEFASNLRRASVLVKQFGASETQVFLKGAPECMPDVCRPESFPEDYNDLLNYYTHRGYRVIGVATKTVSLNWVKIQKMKRHDAESDLTFLGFIIFENKLKPTTTKIIEELGAARIRRVMCTGDNILTAISVARECTLIDPGSHCFVPHFAEGDARNPLSRLVWESIDNPIFTLDERTLTPVPPQGEHGSQYDLSGLQSYSIAVTGDAFRWIIDYAPEQVLREMLVAGQVFARMSPDEKHELVEKLQSIDYTAGFCGDGANDCGALKAADVGISLSEAEASVAAPFTSRVFDISCVPQVIREGRAALVTSFSCFKYMSLYSAIQFTSVQLLYASASNLGDFQFLFIDLILILPIAIFMGWTGPYPVLSKKRPTANLVSRKVLVPLLGQIALIVLFQLIGFLVVQRQSWYKPPKLELNRSNIRNSQNTTLFLFSCYQYILSAIVMSVGKPFRQSMRHNLPFVITMVVALLVSTYMLFDPAAWVYKLMQLTYMGYREAEATNEQGRKEEEAIQGDPRKHAFLRARAPATGPKRFLCRKTSERSPASHRSKQQFCSFTYTSPQPPASDARRPCDTIPYIPPSNTASQLAQCRRRAPHATANPHLRVSKTSKTPSSPSRKRCATPKPPPQTPLPALPKPQPCGPSSRSRTSARATSTTCTTTAPPSPSSCTTGCSRTGTATQR
ncbi:hypothetical protein FH972_023584 [Carpinus fangiana]|uniref:Cation-transporting ATPase n=1 Tax=Carpinus fangiana TaxID=176857 RepID=A0A5N6KXV3_9ROSI|nr:hypothetical protein FH972_023584 [Carpinus fangiana]